MKPRDYALHELDAKALPNWPANLLDRNRPAAGGGREGRGAPGGRADPADTRPGARPRGVVPPTDPRDLALAENISIGVTKNLLLLQHLIQQVSGRSLKSVDPIVQKVLAVALYQLRFLSRIPASAAVDEAVSQAKKFGQTRAAGFVNAVLRKAAREVADPLPVPPREDPAEYARLALSHPPELFRKLRQLLGDADALRFCEHDQLEPPTIVRAAPGVGAERLAGSAETAPTTLDGATDTSPSIVLHRQPGLFVVTGAKRAVLADWAVRGVAQVQDPTAADVVPQARLAPGQTVLDRCCGLGTKTLQAREVVGESGRVVAVDPAEPRCEALRRLLADRGLTNVSVLCTAWLRELKDRADVPATFDRVLVDVPCSNSGVLARRPEARYHQTDRALRSLMELQDKILDDTAPAVAAGGVMVYSTCSVWPEENGDRVRAFLARHGEFELVEERTTWPSSETDPTAYRDGGYWAVLRRR